MKAGHLPAILNSPYGYPRRHWELDESGQPTQKIVETERHLLYVACTRARDHLLVTGVDPVSEFLDDLK